MTEGQSASLSWNKAFVWGLRPDFYYCQTVVGLLMWCVLSNEKTGLSFTIAPGPRQRSYFRVRGPWYSWPYLLSQIRDFPFRRLLRLAGLRWRYSTPPPHGSWLCACLDGCLFSLRSPWKMLAVLSYLWKPLLIPLTRKPLLHLRLHGNA
jgi:hypothetical protein